MEGKGGRVRDKLIEDIVTGGGAGGAGRRKQAARANNRGGSAARQQQKHHFFTASPRRSTPSLGTTRAPFITSAAFTCVVEVERSHQTTKLRVEVAGGGGGGGGLSSCGGEPSITVSRAGDKASVPGFLLCVECMS